MYEATHTRPDTGRLARRDQQSHEHQSARLHFLRVQLLGELALLLLVCCARTAVVLRRLPHRLFFLKRRPPVEQPLVSEDALDLALLKACLLDEAQLLVEEARFVLEPRAPRFVLDPATMECKVP